MCPPNKLNKLNIKKGKKNEKESSFTDFDRLQRCTWNLKLSLKREGRKGMREQEGGEGKTEKTKEVLHTSWIIIFDKMKAENQTVIHNAKTC